MLFLEEVLESGHLSVVGEVLRRAMEIKLIPHSPFPIPFPATELVGDGNTVKFSLFTRDPAYVLWRDYQVEMHQEMLCPVLMI